MPAAQTDGRVRRAGGAGRAANRPVSAVRSVSRRLFPLIHWIRRASGRLGAAFAQLIGLRLLEESAVYQSARVPRAEMPPYTKF